MVASYLITCSHANMLGFYALPVAYISTDTGIPIEGASKALQRLCDEGFCRYDPKAEVVWVVEMARQQIGDALEPKDKRCIAIAREYESLPNNQFLKEFFEEYGSAFHIKSPRDLKAPSKGPKQGASEAPSKPAAVAVAVTAPNTAAATATATKGSAAARRPRKDGEAKSGPAWEAFTDAYRERYHTEPTRNAVENAAMAAFVELVPLEEAPKIAVFYVWHNKAWYVSHQHSVKYLRQDAAGLRTQWSNGNKVTDTEARQADQTAARGDQAQRLLNKHGVG